MSGFIKKFKINSILTAILTIALGVVLIVKPGDSLHVACVIIGAVLGLTGIISILTYIFRKDNSLVAYFGLISGIVVTLIGAWILISPDKLLNLVPILMGIIIIVHGIRDLQQAVTLCKGHYGKWWVALIFGLITTAAGVFLIVNPFGQKLDSLVMILGFILLFDGVTDFWIGACVFGNARRIRKEAKEAEKQADEVEEECPSEEEITE